MALQRKTNLQRTKPIKKRGKYYTTWIKWRKKWLENHPPDADGFYTCGICNLPVHKDVVTLDHIKPRSTHPHLRFDANNVRPAHKFCNQDKGSKYGKATNREYGRNKRDTNTGKASTA